MRDEKRRVRDMLEAIERIERIEKYAVRGRKVYPEIPWSEIIGMRTILVHRYFDVDPEVVWSVVERDLPVLKAGLERLARDTP